MLAVFDNKEECCGCSACNSICPNQAITMYPDKEGFLYPDINQKLCVNCSLCRKVCPLQNKVNIQNGFENPLVFAFKHKVNKVRMTSASGGAYTAISDYALELGYVIYGAEFNKNFIVCHTAINRSEEREKLKGSKYVQSNMNHVFKQIASFLKKGRGVLFTGTGCQVAGLRKYLETRGINMEKLLLNDIICHGTPSPMLWIEYLNLIQKKSKLKTYTFRSKEIGWQGYNVKAQFQNGKCKTNTTAIKIFANLFSTDLVLRPSCYHCKFCILHRPSDILIGDFWGIEKYYPEMDDEKGISLVLINTEKGQKVFDRIRESAEIVESNTIDCLQPNLQHPTKLPDQRGQFWEDYYKFGFQYIAKKYAGYSFKERVKKMIVSSINLIRLQLHL